VSLLFSLIHAFLPTINHHYTTDMPPKKKPHNSTNEKEENSSTHPTVLPLSLPTGGGTPTLADKKAQQNVEMDALESLNSTANFG